MWNAYLLYLPSAQLLKTAGPRVYSLTVDVSDGVLNDVFTIGIVAGQSNRPPSLQGATFDLKEGSPINTPVGVEPNATGEPVPCWNCSAWLCWQLLCTGAGVAA